ncbi:MAG: hypothetical protein ACERLB_12045 [Gammaproteobacteria bacterium]
MNCLLNLPISIGRRTKLPRQRYDCVVAFHPVTGVKVVQPGSGNAELAASRFRYPQKRRSDAGRLALEIIQNGTAATSNLLVIITMFISYYVLS